MSVFRGLRHQQKLQWKITILFLVCAFNSGSFHFKPTKGKILLCEIYWLLWSLDPYYCSSWCFADGAYVEIQIIRKSQIESFWVKTRVSFVKNLSKKEYKVSKKGLYFARKRGSQRLCQIKKSGRDKSLKKSEIAFF